MLLLLVQDVLLLGLLQGPLVHVAPVHLLELLTLLKHPPPYMTQGSLLYFVFTLSLEGRWGIPIHQSNECHLLCGGRAGAPACSEAALLF